MDYSEKTSDYFGNTRFEIIDFMDIPQENLKILEVGAAYGETLFSLKQQGKAAETVGVDIFEDLKNRESYKTIDRMIFGNIENMELPEYKSHFDIILLLDVLEHLVDPGIVLQKLKQYMAEDGHIIVSMPNIRHFSALIKIFFKGNFKYEKSGLFDYTHMRFYCRRDIEELLTSNGFSVVKQEGSIRNYKGMSKTKFFHLLTFGLMEEFFSYQYFFKIRKAR
ncbi:MAG TPA: class I SAM-dependent methyltransferase [Flavobacterium sp.]|nr:class I SAM-dependent methyltransferase [Flavobacterium sp.]